MSSAAATWPSFTPQSVWPLGALGAIARIDHALVNNGVCSLHVKNLPAKGSDHRPFEITLAVRDNGADACTSVRTQLPPTE